MKLKPKFFLLARVILLMSAPSIISGMPGVAAAVPSTTINTTESDPAVSFSGLVTVNQYAEMLRSVAVQSDDKGLAAVANDAILSQKDDQGNFSYQVVEGKGEEPMTGLNLDQTYRYCNWVQNERPQGIEDETTTEEGAYTLASATDAEETITPNEGAHNFVFSFDDSGFRIVTAEPVAVTATKSSTSALIFTPEQLKQVNQPLNTIINNPLANNVFEQKAITTAIIALLGSMGLKVSAGTLNNISKDLQYAAAGLLAFAAVPVLAEFAAHAFEGYTRNQLKKTDPTKVEELNQRERANAEIAKEAKKYATALNVETPMVYLYESPLAQKLASFATNWREFGGHAFKFLGFHIATDEVHLPNNQENATRSAQENLEQVQASIKEMTDKAKSLTQEPLNNLNELSKAPGVENLSLLGHSALESARSNFAEMRNAQRSCLVKGIGMAANKFYGGLDYLASSIDDRWEAFQMNIRHGGVPAASSNTGESDSINAGALRSENDRSENDRSKNYGSYDRTSDRIEDGTRDPSPEGNNKLEEFKMW